MLLLLGDNLLHGRRKSNDVKLLNRRKTITKKKVTRYPNRYKLILHSIDSYLTQREVECIALMMPISKKKHIIADYLGLSVPTIDYYLINAIRRFKCCNSTELLYLIWHSDFFSKIIEIGQLILKKHHLTALSLNTRKNSLNFTGHLPARGLVMERFIGAGR